MANLIKGLDLDTPASEECFMELITHRTTLSAGVIKNVQESEAETLKTLFWRYFGQNCNRQIKGEQTL